LGKVDLKGLRSDGRGKNQSCTLQHNQTPDKPDELVAVAHFYLTHDAQIGAFFSLLP